MTDMQKFVGTKRVYAKPMNRLEYSTLRGWELAPGENGEDEGYLIEYVDGGAPNHPEFKGYISWSPKDVFERSYSVVQTKTIMKVCGIDCHKGRNGCNNYCDNEAVSTPPYKTFELVGFTEAKNAMLSGKRITKLAWIHANIFMYYVPGARYKAQTDIAKKVWGEDGMVPYAPYIAICMSDGVVNIWQPTTTLLLEDDWIILED